MATAPASSRSRSPGCAPTSPPGSTASIRRAGAAPVAGPARNRARRAAGRTARAPAPATAVPGSAEEAYNAGYRLWDQRRFAEAQAALEAAATRYPTGRWISWTRNLQGRAYLDDGKPATAARILLANYQDNPRGERAADSLFYLGEALTRLNRRTEACRVYDELARVYPDMRDQIRAPLPAGPRAPPAVHRRRPTPGPSRESGRGGSGEGHRKDACAKLPLPDFREGIEGWAPQEGIPPFRTLIRINALAGGHRGKRW